MNSKELAKETLRALYKEFKHSKSKSIIRVSAELEYLYISNKVLTREEVIHVYEEGE